MHALDEACADLGATYTLTTTEDGARVVRLTLPAGDVVVGCDRSTQTACTVAVAKARALAALPLTDA